MSLYGASRKSSRASRSCSTAFEIKQTEFEKVLPSTKIDGFIQKPGTTKSICATIERVLEE